MTDVDRTLDLLPPGTPVDLGNCEREPIHVPGSIQPREVLIEVDDPDFVVRQVSANLADLVGDGPWEGALGRPLAEVLGTRPAQAVIRSAGAFGDLRERNPVEITLDVAGAPVPVDALLHTGWCGAAGPATAPHCRAPRSWSNRSRPTGRVPSRSPTPVRPYGARSPS